MSTRASVLKVYRTLLRQAQRMSKTQTELEVRKPLTQPWGHYGYSEVGLAYQAQALATLIPNLATFPGAEVLNGQSLKQVVRANFQAHKQAEPSRVAPLLDEAFGALRALLEQLYLQKCSSSCVTEGVKIEATSCFSTTGSSWQGQEQYVFTYRVRVTNLRQESIQIRGREWTIKNDQGQVLVHVPLMPGNAVVGQQPMIPPGDCFEYYSGTDLDTAAGLQCGSLEIALFEDGQKKRFTRTIVAEIAPFPHMAPGALQAS